MDLTLHFIMLTHNYEVLYYHADNTNLLFSEPNQSPCNSWNNPNQCAFGCGAPTDPATGATCNKLKNKLVVVSLQTHLAVPLIHLLELLVLNAVTDQIDHSQMLNPVSGIDACVHR